MPNIGRGREMTLKWWKDFQPYIVLFGLLAIVLIEVLFFVKLFFGFEDAIITGILSLIGSLVGSAITLLGVILTIRYQDKRRVIDNYPLKLRSVGRIMEKLEELLDVFVMFKGEDNHKEKMKSLVIEILDESAKVDKFTYGIAKSVDTHVNYIFLYELTMKKIIQLDEWGQPKISNVDEFNQVWEDTYKALSDIQNSMIMRLKVIDKEYLDSIKSSL